MVPQPKKGSSSFLSRQRKKIRAMEYVYVYLQIIMLLVELKFQNNKGNFTKQLPLKDFGLTTEEEAFMVALLTSISKSMLGYIVQSNFSSKQLTEVQSWTVHFNKSKNK